MILFDEQARRARRLTMLPAFSQVLTGWASVAPDWNAVKVLGFDPERTWKPTFGVVRMARGYRLFELDVGMHEYVDQRQLSNWWQPALDWHKRLPTMAAVEMYLRHIA